MPSSAARRLRVSLVAILAVVAMSVLAPSASASSTTTTAPAPKQWDPQIQPIAEKVAALRHLEFDHPVEVRFLSEAAFEKRQRGSRDDLSASDEAQLRRTQGQLRALGIIGQDVDLFEAGNDIGSSDVLAYYNPSNKRITVKGTGDLDAATELTVAHELTHALQDQRFDLGRLRRVGARNHACPTQCAR